MKQLVAAGFFWLLMMNAADLKQSVPSEAFPASEESRADRTEERFGDKETENRPIPGRGNPQSKINRFNQSEASFHSRLRYREKELLSEKNKATYGDDCPE